MHGNEARSRNTSAAQRVAAAYTAVAEVDRAEIWIHLRPYADAAADALSVDDRVAAGTRLPLAGTVIAVKDNIDVAGLPTTAGCPEFSYMPTESAAAVQRLVDAGAVVLGKANLDQFATGLVGTRSPYGVVPSAWHPDLVSGGSSSGSAVAVALGIVDFALGTDTAGSGRVPAAFNGIIGIKPTLGIIPAQGVVPACIDYDTITIFARDLDIATTAFAIMAGPDARDPRSRSTPADVALAAPALTRLAIPLPSQLDILSPSYRHAWAQTIDSLAATDISVEPVDLAPLIDAARLLYDGAIVAERYSAVGAFIDADPTRIGLDPTVAAIILGAKDKRAVDLINDLDTVRQAAAYAAAIFDEYDGLLLPTTPEHPTISDVAADPVAINSQLGTFTNFCNLIDLSAVAVPGHPTSDGKPFGITVIEPAFADQIAIDLAQRIIEVTSSNAGDERDLSLAATNAVPLAVFGAHRRGSPLHHELESIHARYIRDIETSNAYRLYALATNPPKPGVVRTKPGAGEHIKGELYLVSPAGLGSFLAALPAPMALSAVELSDGHTPTGFTCTHDALDGAADITEYRDWLAYLATCH